MAPPRVVEGAALFGKGRGGQEVLGHLSFLPSLTNVDCKSQGLHQSGLEAS